MPDSLSPHKHQWHAEQYVADFFRSNHWGVEMLPHDRLSANLIIQHGHQRFIVTVKGLSESRPDRVLPMLSMAILQAQAAAKQFVNALPLAIILVPEASLSLANRVVLFAQQYAQEMSVGVISERGEQYFSGEPFQSLNRMPEASIRSKASRPIQAVNLFSDLNQWMLKLLLAWELPSGLLNAPKRQFKSGAELAELAQVSAMSASRFLQQLRREGYLSESSSHLQLVRREELFRRWSAASMRSSPEIPCRFVLRVPAAEHIRGLLGKHSKDACLGLFAAADELDIGHVSGVPPYVYVHKLPKVGASDWPGLMESPSDGPDLIFKQASFPQSIFRGAVNRNGILVADIFQVWLDVMNHPTRGAEQAEQIYRRYLLPLIAD